ncbi:MAG: galactokinase [Ruminococcaceae bacterium]|nr:galactokinase [Oscillospiraceae bacterium]
MEDLKKQIKEKFSEIFPNNTAPRLFSAPGRTELGGNHTDHQNGRVLAAAVNLEFLAAAKENGSDFICIKSGNYRMIRINTNELRYIPREKGTTIALVRGVCSEINKRGFEVKGFDACIMSKVPRGSGLSSSAAFEVLIGTIVNSLFCNNNLGPTDIAVIGQAAENKFFGKPCGLMDQMASAWGGIVSIDFENKLMPTVKKLSFDFESSGYSLIIVDVKSDHTDMTGEYAAITEEMREVSKFFGKSFLRETDKALFYKNISKLRKAAGDRAVLRAIHFFDENARVSLQEKALEQGNVKKFLNLVGQSGLSSWLYLQNINATGSSRNQAMAVALALCNKILDGSGAARVHGGGFGGTIQVFVPKDKEDELVKKMEAVFGVGACTKISVRQYGSTELKE